MSEVVFHAASSLVVTRGVPALQILSALFLLTSGLCSLFEAGCSLKFGSVTYPRRYDRPHWMYWILVGVGFGGGAVLVAVSVLPIVAIPDEPRSLWPSVALFGFTAPLAVYLFFRARYAYSRRPRYRGG